MARAKPPRRKAAGVALFLAPLALSALVYYPITGNYFYADDFLNLYQIGNNSLLQYLITPNGGHVLVTRNAVFYVMHLLFGTQPEYYFWAALLTHLLNVSLLFGVIHAWTHSTRLASFGAALWGCSPLNEGALGWYAVYGHVLVGTFMLMILYQVARLAAGDGRPSRRRLRFWYGLALAAATSFGTGLGVAMALPFALWILLPESGAAARRRPPLVSLVIVVPVLYVALIWAYAFVAGDDSVTRPPLAVLTNPWTSIPIAGVRLTAFALTRLLCGFPFPAWATPSVWYATLAVFLAVAVLIARLSPGPLRRQLAACALLLAGCYGAIAVGRGAFLQSPAFYHLISALPRYQYVGVMLLATVCCLLLARIARGLSGWAGTAALLVWYAVSL